MKIQFIATDEYQGLPSNARGVADWHEGTIQNLGPEVCDLLLRGFPKNFRKVDDPPPVKAAVGPTENKAVKAPAEDKAVAAPPTVDAAFVAAAVDAGVIERKGPWFKYKRDALGRSVDDVIAKLKLKRRTLAAIIKAMQDAG